MIADTSVVVAAVNRRDQSHRLCAGLLSEWGGAFIIPAPVITEVAQLVGSPLRGGGPWLEAEFLRSVALMQVECPNADDYERAAQLVAQYATFDGGMGIGAVDALVVAVAERLKDTKVATLDRTHFSAIRPAHALGFELYP